MQLNPQESVSSEQIAAQEQLAAQGEILRTEQKDFVSQNRKRDIDINRLEKYELEEDQKYTNLTTLKNFLIDSMMSIIEETKQNKSELYLKKIIPYKIKRIQMNNLPVSMFVKIFSAAIIRLSEVKDQLIKDLEQNQKTKKNSAQSNYEKLLQKAEASIRMHISKEQQLKVILETAQQKIEELQQLEQKLLKRFKEKQEKLNKQVEQIKLKAKTMIEKQKKELDSILITNKLLKEQLLKKNEKIQEFISQIELLRQKSLKTPNFQQKKLFIKLKTPQSIASNTHSENVSVKQKQIDLYHKIQNNFDISNLQLFSTFHNPDQFLSRQKSRNQSSFRGSKTQLKRNPKFNTLTYNKVKTKSFIKVPNSTRDRNRSKNSSQIKITQKRQLKTNQRKFNTQLNRNNTIDFYKIKGQRNAGNYTKIRMKNKRAESSTRQKIKITRNLIQFLLIMLKGAKSKQGQNFLNMQQLNSNQNKNKNKNKLPIFKYTGKKLQS